MVDGFNLIYIKNGIVYPVALTPEQDNILQNVVPGVVSNGGTIKVIQDKPLGEAIK